MHTERLIMKTPTSGMERTILAYYIRNKKHLTPFEPIRSDVFYTGEYWCAELKRQLRLMGEGQEVRFYLFKKDDPEQLIGAANFTSIVRGAFHSCFLGYSMDGNEQGKGYMTEALSAAIPYMFNECKLHRIQANYMPGNKASQRVLEKLGFKREGYAVKYLRIAGKWEDHVLTSLINENME